MTRTNASRCLNLNAISYGTKIRHDCVLFLSRSPGAGRHNFILYSILWGFQIYSSTSISIDISSSNLATFALVRINFQVCSMLTSEKFGFQDKTIDFDWILKIYSLMNCKSKVEQCFADINRKFYYWRSLASSNAETNYIIFVKFQVQNLFLCCWFCSMILITKLSTDSIFQLISKELWLWHLFTNVKCD